MFQKQTLTIQRNLKFQHMVRTRAWVCSSAIHIVRLFEIVFKTGGWFSETVFCEDEKTDECIGYYNKDLMDPLEPVLSKVLLVIVIITATFNVLTYKKRWLADYLNYLELFARLVAIMLPNAAGYFYRNDMLHAVVFGALFIMLFAGSGFEIIFSSLVLLFHFFVGASVNYGEPELTT